MRDDYNPESAWEFNSDVTDVFDDMLMRSIPGYVEMRRLTTSIASRFAQRDSFIVDLGCSRGGAISNLIEILDESINFLGVEISAPMREAAVQSFKKFGDRVKIVDMDLKSDFPKVNSSVILSVLTLQFIPIEYRQGILQKVYNSLIPNGAFIIVEKVLGNNSVTNELFIQEYYKLKGQNGYTPEQINTKRKSLEGILVPVTSDWNQDLLKNSGFSSFDCFWRNLNFAGWIAIK